MRLTNLTAVAHSGGNRIDLSWTYPDSAQHPGVRVVRREDSHPVDVDDGVQVAGGAGITSVSDLGLQGERVYYYSLFPFSGDPPKDDPDPHGRASAMALSPYDFGGQMYALLPAIYQRYDADRLPAAGTVAEADKDKGELRRFLDLPGAELDRLYSLARAALDLTDLDRVDGRLLPLLAQWIGWRTNFGLAVGAQRGEIRFAPRIYQTVGGVPALDATVARVTGLANSTKEFVHNVARSNEPERLNLWSAVRDPAGNWAAPALASVNFAYDGRPAAVRDTDGSALFFYHTRREHGWDIWAKPYTTADGWGASRPVVDRPGVDKNPAAALQGDKLWLFWQSYDTELRRWQVWVATRAGGVWSPPEVFGDKDTPRRLPAAVVDNAGGLWLFWLERLAGIWQLRYNRNNGTGWLDTPQTMPLDGGVAPRVEDDLFVLFHPTSSAGRLWLFWARQEPGGPAGQTRWRIVYRVKQALDPRAADWSQIRPLPKSGSGGYHDRQPAALLAGGGNIELFFSSTQDGGWGVSRNLLTTSSVTWGSNERLGTGAYTRRAPLAFDTGAGTLLAYRSNQSIAYGSDVYGATHTLDNRYAGSTTVDSTAQPKRLLFGKLDDFQTYTYDTGSSGRRNDDNRIARDTVGVYLGPTKAVPQVTDEAISRLAGVLADYLPVTARAVFVKP
ncbi:hypothetical protein [Dactylosporangium sp. NPDC051541]|uniref:hypothetical protein n=1 Tax=Dactylosporangium sp. NPDC051541 TaxID=3363977 RepID=UPI0037999EC1